MMNINNALLDAKEKALNKVNIAQYCNNTEKDFMTLAPSNNIVDSKYKAINWGLDYVDEQRIEDRWIKCLTNVSSKILFALITNNQRFISNLHKCCT